MKTKFIITLVLTFCLFFQSCSEKSISEYTARINAMDTVAFIRVYDEKYANVADECAELMIKLEAELSVTLTGSRVYHLNKSGSVPLTNDLKNIIEYSDDLYSKTDGAFNPCVYPLVKLWGFTENSDDQTIPNSKDISRLKELVQSSRLYVEDGKAYVTSNGAVDFGGIAKGYAAELMMKKLKENGVNAALIDLGGNIQTVGEKNDGTEWNIAINDPAGDGFVCVLSLGETAVVTSGSDVRYFIGDDGKKYHHIIDTKTGRPVETELLSVSVIHPNAAIADGLSTAFFVLGIDKALPIAATYDAEVVFVKSGEVLITKGLENKFTPDTSAEGKYKLTVLS